MKVFVVRIDDSGIHVDGAMRVEPSLTPYLVIGEATDGQNVKVRVEGVLVRKTNGHITRASVVRDRTMCPAIIRERDDAEKALVLIRSAGPTSWYALSDVPFPCPLNLKSVLDIPKGTVVFEGQLATCQYCGATWEMKKLDATPPGSVYVRPLRSQDCR